MKKNDDDRLALIVLYGSQLLDVAKETDLSADQLNSDYRLQWLVTTPLYNIGEQAYGLSNEFVEEHGDVPWRMIADFRHRLVHNYEGTNWNLVAAVIEREIEPLVESARKILEERGADE